MMARLIIIKGFWPLLASSNFIKICMMCSLPAIKYRAKPYICFRDFKK